MQRQLVSLLVPAAILAVAACEEPDPVDPALNLNAAPTLVSEAPFTDFFGTGSGVAGTASPRW